MESLILIGKISFQIGYRSMMRGSQSISDLSNLPPEKDNNNLRGGVSGRASVDGYGDHRGYLSSPSEVMGHMATAATTSEDDESLAGVGVATNRLHSSLLLAAHNNNYYRNNLNAGTKPHNRPSHSHLLQLARSLELGGTVSDSDFLCSTTRSLSGRPVRLVMEQNRPGIQSSGSTRVVRNSRSVSPRSTNRYKRHLVLGSARNAGCAGVARDAEMGVGMHWGLVGKGRKASTRTRVKSPSSESDTSSMVSTPGFVDYLNTLSECPGIDRQSGQ
eukprot:TCALIF_07176-PA protein Name:"Protein of unknown function" AED:0.08 eAED:0.08 QI:0/1/0/1/1/0.5/2/0/273